MPPPDPTLTFPRPVLPDIHVAAEESFLAFPGEGYHKEPLRVAQPQTEQMHLEEAAIQVDLGFSPVHLRLSHP